ncbi:MAG: hypothetical protein IT285_13765 [Bdellovibrionales bacterium]|nr:hypothetical protein [Bdellovibrionales bacterium]
MKKTEELIDSKEGMRIGRKNIVAGLWTMAAFMFLGFALVYLRDFAPGAAEWAAQYSTGKHFETRLAHVHGTLFGFLNVMIGYLLFQVRICRKGAKTVSMLALLGILMPVGILGEVLLGTSPVFVLVGAGSMTFSMILFGGAIWRHRDSA